MIVFSSQYSFSAIRFQSTLHVKSRRSAARTDAAFLKLGSWMGETTVMTGPMKVCARAFCLHPVKTEI